MKLLSQNHQFFDDINPKLLELAPDLTLVQWVPNLGVVPKTSILCATSLEANQVVDSVIQMQATNLIQKNKGFFESDLKMTLSLVQKPGEYFARNCEVLIPEPGETLLIEFSGPADKEKLMADAESFLSKGVNANALESSRVVLEELYMNAIFDAPREAAKQGLDIRRVQDEKIKSKIWIKLAEARLAISCEDPYGSLSIRKFLLRMKEVYDRGAGESMRMGLDGGGAGLGCVLMFENSSSLVLGVLPGVKTLVSCLIPTKMSRRHRDELKKNLHLLEA